MVVFDYKLFCTFCLFEFGFVVLLYLNCVYCLCIWVCFVCSFVLVVVCFSFILLVVYLWVVGYSGSVVVFARCLLVAYFCLSYCRPIGGCLALAEVVFDYLFWFVWFVWWCVVLLIVVIVLLRYCVCLSYAVWGVVCMLVFICWLLFCLFVCLLLVCVCCFVIIVYGCVLAWLLIIVL